LLVFVAGCLMAVCLGCAGSRPGSAKLVAAHSGAPDDAALHVNPNAPFIMPGATPRLVPRPTEADVKSARACDTDVLSVDEIAGTANGSYRSVKLAFMNRGPVPCTLGGYPAVTLFDSGGQSIGSIEMEKVTAEKVTAELSEAPTPAAAAPTAQVTLMPHAVAAFEVAWSAGTNCSKVARILVRAPGTEKTFAIARPMSICTGRIQVTQLRLDEGNV
jgi:Protein of unknown function (DUF4232)